MSLLVFSTFFHVLFFVFPKKLQKEEYIKTNNMRKILTLVLLFVFIRDAFPKCAEIPEDFKPTAAKKLLKNRKLLGMVEQKLRSFMGLSGKPKNRTRKRQVHVPDHIWKLYNKWNNKDNDEKMSEPADTARLIHSGMNYFFLSFLIRLSFFHIKW